MALFQTYSNKKPKPTADGKNQFGTWKEESGNLRASTLTAVRCNNLCPFNDGAEGKTWQPRMKYCTPKTEPPGALSSTAPQWPLGISIFFNACSQRFFQKKFHNF